MRVADAAGPVTAHRRPRRRPAPHATMLSLHAGLARLDVDSRVTGAFEDVLGWTFGFGVENPVLLHEEIGAIIAARLVGDGEHYSARAARCDWLTFNHFCALGPREGDGPWVVLANRDCLPTAGFQHARSARHGRSDDHRPRRRSGGRADAGHPGQGGIERHDYRFAITTMDRFDAAAAMRFALEATNPLHAARVTGARGGQPSMPQGLLTISDPDVVL
ncbi:MAG: hypothetical protein U0470_01835 [Anaerolineae bacterium]